MLQVSSHLGLACEAPSQRHLSSDIFLDILCRTSHLQEQKFSRLLEVEFRVGHLEHNVPPIPSIKLSVIFSYRFCVKHIPENLPSLA